MGLNELLLAFFLATALLLALHAQRAIRARQEVTHLATGFLPDSFDVGEMLLTARKQVSSLAGDEAVHSSQSFDEREHATSLAATVGEAAVLYGSDAAAAFWAFDARVYEGIERLSGESFFWIADLSKRVEDYSHDFTGELSSGALNKVAGQWGGTRSGAPRRQGSTSSGQTPQTRWAGICWLRGTR